MMYLTSIIESAIINALEQININIGAPNGYTETWDVVTKAINEDLWFIMNPPIEGWGNTEIFTQEQMMADIDMTDIIEQERNADWFPVPTPYPTGD